MPMRAIPVRIRSQRTHRSSRSGDRHVMMIDRRQLAAVRAVRALDAAGTAAGRRDPGAIFDLLQGRAPSRRLDVGRCGGPADPSGPGALRRGGRGGAINHALRFTVQHTRRAYISPGRHWASSYVRVHCCAHGHARAAQGARQHLRVSAAGRRSCALKKYGMIVADNGSNCVMCGHRRCTVERHGVNNSLKALRVSDFEVVRMMGIVTSRSRYYHLSPIIYHLSSIIYRLFAIPYFLLVTRIGDSE